jgi:acyl-CoA reductase-like NAD-dependent aldehyde dehydrogenase
MPLENNMADVQSINPATGEMLGAFHATTAPEVKNALSLARAAQKDWAKTSTQERVGRFGRLAEAIQERSGSILDLIKLETGKLRPDAEAELFDVIDAVDYYCDEYKKVVPDLSVKLNPEAFSDTDLELDFVPHGVIGVIMPWNFPFYCPAIIAIAATLAGNAVLIKPSEYSTMIGQLVGELFRASSFPSDLVQIIPGGDQTGRDLVKSGVDKIFFVGSIEAGKDVVANAGIVPVEVELGGNSSALVLEEADLDLAAAGIAYGATYHSGQDCVGIKRIFVVETVAESFISKLVEIIKGLRPGIDYGPYIPPEAALQVKKRIEDAVNHGAKLLCGGEMSSPGNWLTPSVLTYEDSGLDLVASETFGNVAPVMVVPDAEAAIREANQTEYGLSNAVFTRNQAQAREVASRLESGMVFINDPFVTTCGWDHWTGWKNSGFGTVESKLMQCLKKRVLSVNRTGVQRSFWYPYKV